MKRADCRGELQEQRRDRRTGHEWFVQMDHVEGLFFAWSLGVLFGGYDPARMRAATVTA